MDPGVKSGIRKGGLRNLKSWQDKIVALTVGGGLPQEDLEMTS